ncbi:MAG: hypothetical protein AB7I37_19465 [Pirellulales bacterium]
MPKHLSVSQRAAIAVQSGLLARETVNPSGPGKARQRVARMVGVSERQISYADRVARESPDDFRLCVEGKLAVWVAQKRLPKVKRKPKRLSAFEKLRRECVAVVKSLREKLLTMRFLHPDSRDSILASLDKALSLLSLETLRENERYFTSEVINALKVKVEHENEIRRAAWSGIAPECRQQWKGGWRRRFPRAFTTGDVTLIPGFDVLAAGLAEQFPELDRTGDPATALFELLSRPVAALPPKEDIRRMSVELAQLTFSSPCSPPTSVDEEF